MDIVQELAATCPELISNRTKNGRTSLHCLCLAKLSNLASYTNIARLLLDQDPSLLHAVDKCGTLPLVDALRQGNTHLAEILLQESEDGTRDLQMADKVGRQAIHIAVEAGMVSYQKFNYFMSTEDM